MISRQNPSLFKIQYLLHFKECHSLAADACRANALVISRLCHPLPVPYHLLWKSETLRTYEANFDYLAGELEKHAERILGLIQSISDQIELFDKRRNKVIGLFIAVYVPLAFITVGSSFYSIKRRSRASTNRDSRSLA